MANRWMYVVWMVAIGKVHAFPSFRQSFPNAERVPCTEDMGGCQPGTEGGDPVLICQGVGHATCEGGSMPLNSFGLDFAAAGFQWTKDLCEKDSDGDGWTNGEELGDPCCVWAPHQGFAQSIEQFVPSHPGFSSSTLKGYARRDCGDVPSGVSVDPSAGKLNTFFLEGEDERHADVTIAGHTVSSASTSYVYFALNFEDPDCVENACYIVGMESLVDDKHVHHYLIHGCEDPFSSYQNGQRVLPIQSDCNLFLGGWIPGRDIMINAPVDASIPFGGNTGRPLHSFLLNVHYDNPNGDVGAVDRSGFRVHYTTKPRAHALGAFYGLQAQWDPLTRIPPGVEKYFITQTCELEGMEEPVNLYSLGFHAHLLGREMHSVLYKDGQKIVLVSDSVWDYDDQYTHYFDEDIWVENGDVIQSSCIYNSMARSTSTPIGERTQDEMCSHAFQVYPEQKNMRCKEDRYWGGQLYEGEDVLDIRELRSD